MTGNLSHSMRTNYNTHGVEGYYKIVGESYRNPHYPALKKCLFEWMDRYSTQHSTSTEIQILDLAAGSGEVTEALLAWKASRWPPVVTPPNHIIDTTRRRQPLSFPDRKVVRPVTVNPRDVVSRIQLPVDAPTLSIVATDPFTSAGYESRTGLPCLPLSFTNIAEGHLPPTEKLYNLVIVSFALHLVPTNSQLWALLLELSKRCEWLLVIAPHKKPDIKPTWNWRRWDLSLHSWSSVDRSIPTTTVGGIEGDGYEIVMDKVRLRAWRSEVHWSKHI